MTTVIANVKNAIDRVLSEQRQLLAEVNRVRDDLRFLRETRARLDAEEPELRAASKNATDNARIARLDVQQHPGNPAVEEAWAQAEESAMGWENALVAHEDTRLGVAVKSDLLDEQVPEIVLSLQTVAHDVYTTVKVLDAGMEAWLVQGTHLLKYYAALRSAGLPVRSMDDLCVPRPIGSEGDLFRNGRTFDGNYPMRDWKDDSEASAIYEALAPLREARMCLAPELHRIEGNRIAREVEENQRRRESAFRKPSTLIVSPSTY